MRREGQRWFYLVQRVYESPRERFKEMGFKNDANPFGYGRLGNYELDYMGSSEFEWGAIPDSLSRFSDAYDKEDIMRGEATINGHKICFLYIGSDGDPIEDFLRWIAGDGFNRPFASKEIPHDFHDALSHANVEKRLRETVVWWSLDDDVMWSFVEEDGSSHLDKMLESMSETAPHKVRDFR